jgi:hypothetical protein
MLGRDESAERCEGLNAPLESGDAFSVDEDGEKTWYPNWEANVAHATNRKFLDEVVKLVLQGDSVSCAERFDG